MSLNDGLLNEQRLIDAINDKRYSELNNNLQHFVNFLFPKIDRQEKFKCFAAEKYTKPDICIQHLDKRRYISVKHGTSTGVHGEKLDNFIEFLRENNFDDYTIESYLLFHFGDGTTDGTGERRLDQFHVRAQYDERIRALNEAFNKNKEFVKKFTDRVMFQGVSDTAEPADILYHGDEDFGCFMSRKQLMRHIDFRRWEYMTYLVHIGPFSIAPKARYPEREIKNNEFRTTVVVNYPKLLNDIQYIFSRYIF